MPDYRRYYVPGGTVFLTVVTGNRVPLFADAGHVERLKTALRSVHEERPFEIAAGVILPDHMHFLWTLPAEDVAYSRRLGRMKTCFTKQLGSRPGPRSASQAKHRESGVWQRRFWEHTIRDEDDFLDHLNYVHFNPVRHGLAKCPHCWPHSSFAKWVESGDYPADWGCSCDGRQPPSSPPVFDRIAEAAGE